MGMFDKIFNPQPAAPAQPNQQVANATGTNQPPAQGSGSTQIDTAQQKQNEQGTQTDPSKNSPLDPYKDLWDPTPVEKDDKGNPVVKTDKTQQSPDFVKHAKGLDFSKVINREQATKALGGDVDAFTAIINSVGQASFAASGRMSHTMAAKIAKDAVDAFKETLPAEFKKYSLQDTPLENSAMSHPAAKPMVEAIRRQISEKYPELSTAEATAKAKEYVSATFAAMSAGDKEEVSQTVDSATERTKKQQSGEYPWDDYLK